MADVRHGHIDTRQGPCDHAARNTGGPFCINSTVAVGRTSQIVGQNKIELVFGETV